MQTTFGSIIVIDHESRVIGPSAAWEITAGTLGKADLGPVTSRPIAAYGAPKICSVGRWHGREKSAVPT